MTAFSSPRRIGMWLFVLLLVLYNINGRESGSADTQATKYFARNVGSNWSWNLDQEVDAQPQLGERAAFARGRDGRWRPGYGVVPGLIASVPARALQTIGLVELDAPLAANLIAKITASLLTAGAVTLVFFALLRAAPVSIALLTALMLGVGTNYWGVVSQTLGQQETVAFGLALALWACWRVDPLSVGRVMTAATGLALAGAARPQVAPLVGMLLFWLMHRVGWRRAVAPLLLVTSVAAATITLNLIWFNSALGATTATESHHRALHGVSGPLAEAPWLNALGLLFSPSRGLMVFSPVVLVAVVGLVLAVRRRRTLPPDLAWLAAAVAVQAGLYACYSVWWGGHSFGPRYLLDVLIPLAPFGALGALWCAERPVRRYVALSLAGWSITVAAFGAFVYPNERWNTSPSDIDRAHERLWQIEDSQISRAFHTRPSPQNFNLFSRASVRKPPA